MAILRKKNKQRYTTFLHDITLDENLSLKDFGLLIKLLSLPDDWEFSEKGLEKIFKKDGQASIRTALKNLEQYGYLQRIRTRDEKGRVSNVEWHIYEESQGIDFRKKPHLENPSLDTPSWVNHKEYNIKESNTKESNTKDISISKKARSRSEVQKRELYTQSGGTYTENTTETNISINKGTEGENKEGKISFNDIIEEYTQNEQLRSELKEHLKTRKAKKAPVTNRALILSLNKLDTLANTDEEKIIIVQNSIMNGWSSFFKLNNDHPQYLNNKKCNSFHQEPASYNIDEYESLSIFDD